MMRRYWQITGILVLALLLTGSLVAQTNIMQNGDLETREPAFWSRMNDDGTHVMWAMGGATESEYSFKITKSAAATDAIGWKSDNNANLYWNRANEGANQLFNFGFTAKTDNVNTGPANDDAKIGAWFRFYGSGSLIAEKFVPVDQTSGTMDWTDFSDGVLVSGTPDEVYVELVMNKDATGTVWFDNVHCNLADGWVMGVFNGNAETPVGWMNWTSGDKIGYANVVDDSVHGGSYSTLLEEADENDDEMVFYSIPYPVEAGKWYRISAWMKTEGINTDTSMYGTNVVPDHDVDRLGLCFFFHKAPLETNWDLVGGDQFVYIDQRPGKENEDWKLYTVIAKAPEEAAGVSIRARFNNMSVGKVWYDDFSIEEITVDENILANGDLETREPAFWSRMNDDGTHVMWAMGGATESEYSFKITKSAAATDAIGWKSDNNANLYWNRANEGANQLFNFGFTAKTDNVNTGPANDDAKIGAWFRFYGSGSLIAEKFVPVDQTSGTMDWTDFSDGVLVSGTPDEVYVELVMNKDATGTVWFDNVHCNLADGWVMGVFNGNAETPVGWMNWTSGDKIGYANVVDDSVHGGSYSVLLEENDENDDEMVFYSIPYPAVAGKWYRISAWMKTEDLSTGENMYPTNVTPDHDVDRLGLCFFFHKAPLETNWDLVGGDQFVYIDQRPGKENEDWKLYTVIAQAPEEAAGVSIRARFNNMCTGSVWYDDITIEEVSLVTVSIEDPASPTVMLTNDFNLSNNYPNPFNPTTVIEYTVPKAGPVNLTIYDMLGNKVRTLVDQDMSPGTYHAVWDGRDNTGNTVSTGVYFYQLQGENALITKKMTFIK